MESRLAMKQAPTQLEKDIAKIIHELANSKPEYKEKLKNIKISSAMEMTIKEENKETLKCILIYVPYPSLADTQKNYAKLLTEIEKKKGVITLFVGKRTIVSKRVKTNASQMRPRNRTLTAVHDSILEDLLMPAFITGKRVRYTGARSPIYRVTINEDSQRFMSDARLTVIKSIYKRLTNKTVEIGFKSAINYVQHRKGKPESATAQAPAAATTTAAAGKQ
jgi:small subunit ribosomal protein S7e